MKGLREYIKEGVEGYDIRDVIDNLDDKTIADSVREWRDNLHWSDCATSSGPAMKEGECDCKNRVIL